MKKIFTLLFCAIALSFTASADDLVSECMNTLLSGNGTRLMATNVNAQLDANQDGVISIADVTALIDMKLEQENVNRAPRNTDVESLIYDIISNDQPKANIDDVNEVIEHNLKKK
jgi:hypothetical protein